jgi:hypothetical protein
MDYILKQSLSENDIDFLNETTIKFEIFDTHGLKPETQIGFDSGWCDASTGARIINKNDRAMFKSVSDSELTLLTLKFGDRLLGLHSGLKKIYNVD